MAEPVTVEHGGLTVTTNTATEADLLAELQAPTPETPTPPAETPPGAPGPARDAQGRFAKSESATLPVETPAPPPEAPAATEESSRDSARPRHDPIARMKQALAQKTAAEQRALALEAELARLRYVPSPTAAPMSAPGPPVNGLNEPTFEQFAGEADPYTAYMQAWARWDRAQALEQARAELQAEWTAQRRAETFATNLAQGRTAYPDFETVLTEADTLGLHVSPVMQAAITDSPRAADLVYDLATHPEVCLQLAEESAQVPVAAASVMRRLLESRLAPRVAASHGAGTTARAAVSTAKPPVTPVGSSPVVSDEPPGDSASAAEHARYWNRKLKVPGTKY